MVEEDTVKLLRECNAGIRMGVSSIDEVLPNVKDGGLRQVLKKAALPMENWGTRPMPCWRAMGTKARNPTPWQRVWHG